MADVRNISSSSGNISISSTSVSSAGSSSDNTNGTSHSTSKKLTSSGTEPSTEAKEETPTDGIVVEKEKEKVTFASLGVCKPLCDACAALGWKFPSDIQRDSLPYSLQGRDIIGLAETGSGKTGAFALPILQSLLSREQSNFALCLAPTRELAFQIGETFEALGEGIRVKCVCIVGGVDMIDQAIALAKKPHVIVATPGRIVDHLENTRGFNLRNLQYLVLDEADRLLNMDFEKEIDKVLQVIPSQRTTLLFSATMTTKVAKLQRACLTDPVKVEVSKKYQTVSGLIQQYLFFPAKHKDIYLAYMLTEMAGSPGIIFCSTCEHTQRVTLLLRNLGFGATPLHGKMSQPARLGSLNKFKGGQRELLIATDVAQRGLDIPTVDFVINYDIPTNSKDYIHRVGRTARAGRSGRAFTFVTQYNVELFQRIEHLINLKMECYPTEEQAVMLLMERVGEAQRIAAMQLREEAEGGDGKRKGKKHELTEATEEGGEIGGEQGQLKPKGKGGKPTFKGKRGGKRR